MRSQPRYEAQNTMNEGDAWRNIAVGPAINNRQNRTHRPEQRHVICYMPVKRIYEGRRANATPRQLIGNDLIIADDDIMTDEQRNADNIIAPLVIARQHNLPSSGMALIVYKEDTHIDGGLQMSRQCRH